MEVRTPTGVMQASKKKRKKKRGFRPTGSQIRLNEWPHQT